MAAHKLPGSVAKKVAKKAAKKVAKKAAKKTSKHPGNDARRAYEHLHRLRALHPLLAPPVLEDLQTLTGYAQACFAKNEAKSAADLLRAGEHLAFGSLSDLSGEPSVELRRAIEEEYEHLLDRGDAHWEQTGRARTLAALYKRMRSEATSAWKRKAFHRALEFARGADALAHAAPSNISLGSGEKGEAPSLLLQM